MERRLYAAFFALVSVTAAAGCGQEAPEPQKPSAPAKSPASKPDLGAPEPSPTEGEQDASKNRKAYLKALNKGRSLTRDERYDEAIEVFEEALELDPDDVSLLAELGWAAFLAGEYALCDRMTNRALLFARKDKTRGMLLYNLGRSAEATGKTEAARAHYEHSLRLRDNATVKKRLAGLDDAGTAQDDPAEAGGDVDADADADAGAGSIGDQLDTPLPDVSGDDLPGALGVAHASVADLDAGCAWLVKERCDEVSTFTGDSCRCTPGAAAQDAGFAAAVLTLETGRDDGGNRAAFVASRAGSGAWQLSEAIGWEYNPGAFGIFEELVVAGVQLRTDLFAKKSAALIEIKKERADSNLARNEVETESAEYVVVCAEVQKGKPACTAGLIRKFAFGRTALVDPSDDPEAPVVKEFESKFQTELTFPGDGTVRSSQSPPSDLPRAPTPMVSLPKGDHSLIRLLK